MTDPTEGFRRLAVELINMGYSEEEAECKAELIQEWGEDNVWDTSELTEHFIVESFLAPFCFVTRKSDKVSGTVMFKHSPRYYFNFKEN